MRIDIEETGKRIKQCRKEMHEKDKSITQETFAKEYLHCDTATYRKWEKGTSFPDGNALAKMCELFNCDLGYLTGEYDCKTRIATDICKETGLSVEAVEELHSVKERFEKHSNHLDVSFPIKIELVNYLILNINEIVESIDLLHLLQNNRKRLKEQYNYSFFRDLFVESLRAGDEAEAYFYDLLHDELYKKYEENEEKTYSELEQFKNQNLFDAFKKDNSLDFELWKLNKEILKLIETFIEERQV